MAAARAVGHDQGIRRRLTNCGQEAALRHSHGNFVVLCFVTERSRHAATTRVDDLDRETGNELQRGDNGGHCSERFLVTVAVEDRKSTRLNSSHGSISYAVFCLKKKNR